MWRISDMWRILDFLLYLFNCEHGIYDFTYAFNDNWKNAAQAT